MEGCVLRKEASNVVVKAERVLAFRLLSVLSVEYRSTRADVSMLFVSKRHGERRHLLLSIEAARAAVTRWYLDQSRALHSHCYR